jgi:hypothetical protein
VAQVSRSPGCGRLRRRRETPAADELQASDATPASSSFSTKGAVFGSPLDAQRAIEMDEDRQPRDAGFLGRQSAVQRRSELSTGIIGARRAWTVSMISALSMPCR